MYGHHPLKLTAGSKGGFELALLVNLIGIHLLAMGNRRCVTNLMKIAMHFHRLYFHVDHHYCRFQPK